MKISVVIPTYNSSAFIGATLDSVLGQRMLPDEIIVFDDGSDDDTLEILGSYQPRIVIIQQKNGGVATARNVLSQRASGDLVAFLDHDDLWHPLYLEVMSHLFQKYPSAVAYFSGHVNFSGYGKYVWSKNNVDVCGRDELMKPIEFLKGYNKNTGRFGSMSFCCIPKSVLNKIGREPFRISGVDDSYLCTLLPLLGPVVYMSAPLVAYRLTREAQSVNKLRDMGLWGSVFEILVEKYREQAPPSMMRAFNFAYASKRRQNAKLLFGAGKRDEARSQLIKSLINCWHPVSLVKSLGLLVLSLLPAAMQPRWPSSIRRTEVDSAAYRKNESL
jgi:glycosyltransferase involved in cell wall biosynthesis